MDGTILIMDYSSYERRKVHSILDKIGIFNIIEVGGYDQFKLLNLDIEDLILIIMDPEFPSEDHGFTIIEKIRGSENKDVPVIFTTRIDKQEYKAKALKYYVNDYIIKPYEISRLEASIRTIVKSADTFHYETKFIENLTFSFDNYISREIKYASRTNSPLSLILITTLRITPEAQQENTTDDARKASLFAIAAYNAKDSLRETDTIVQNRSRDIIIVLPLTDEVGAQKVSDKIKSSLEAEFKKMNADKSEYIFPVYVTFPADGKNFQQLMESALQKVASKEMLDRITSIPNNKRKYADKSYGRYQKWF